MTRCVKVDQLPVLLIVRKLHTAAQLHGFVHSTTRFRSGHSSTIVTLGCASGSNNTWLCLRSANEAPSGYQATARDNSGSAKQQVSVTGARRGHNKPSSNKIAATYRQHDGRGHTADRPSRVDLQHLSKPEARCVAVHPVRRPLCHAEDGP